MPQRSVPQRHRATLLLGEITQVTAQFQQQLAAELGVNDTDLDAMQHLIRRGPLTPTDLAQSLDISSASITTAIDRLVALGHVHREPNPRDRRGVLVVPSPESAQRAMGRIDPMIDSLDSEMDAFSPEEQGVIIRYLERILAQYREHAAPQQNAAS